ncbi:MAG: T9SS type A sorting domain-containing protein [Bacteroidetes bacterium]|nr:T9SS type A sorting domain-containing protein [Bacteroidota bacterium]
MKNKIIIIFLTVFTINVQAQSIQRNVIASAGIDNSVSNIRLTSTVGETVTSTLSKSNYKIAQGFQQGKITVARIVNVEDTTEITSDESTTSRNSNSLDENKFKVNVYPNPATEYINIKLTELSNAKHMIYLTDISGRLIESRTISSPETRIEFTSMTSGKYILHIKSEDGKVNESFKIFKL